MDLILDAGSPKASPLLWFGAAIIAGSLFGAITGLWLPHAAPPLAR